MSAVLQNIRSPKWQSADGKIIDVVADIYSDGGKLVASGAPHTLLEGDVTFADAAAGKFGAVAPFTPRPFDFGNAINLCATQVMELPYGAKRNSVNNYLAQLAALKAAGTITPDQQADLDALMKASGWEQAVVDHRDVLLKSGDQAALNDARNISSWPAFPDDAAKVVATC